MIQIGSGNRSTVASNRYANYTNKGPIEELGGIENVTTDMELFAWDGTYKINKYGIKYMSMSHVGRVVVHDFANGPEISIYHSVSEKLSPKEWRAFFYNDTGPNITSLTRLDGTTNWTHYAFADK